MKPALIRAKLGPACCNLVDVGRTSPPAKGDLGWEWRWVALLNLITRLSQWGVSGLCLPRSG